MTNRHVEWVVNCALGPRAANRRQRASEKSFDTADGARSHMRKLAGSSDKRDLRICCVRIEDENG